MIKDLSEFGCEWLEHVVSAMKQVEVR